MTLNDAYKTFLKRYALVIIASLGLLLALTTPTLTGTASAQGSQPTVRVVSHPTLGEILVGPNGMTLYTFANDTSDTSSCIEGCAQNWPPLIVQGEVVTPAGLPGQLGTITRQPDEDNAESALQVTYNGKPLYYWSRDEAPGDIDGQGIGDLWVVAQP